MKAQKAKELLGRDDGVVCDFGNALLVITSDTELTQWVLTHTIEGDKKCTGILSVFPGTLLGQPVNVGICPRCKAWAID